ncbi:MAG: hemolysin secretion/activation protein ShlB family [Pseudomonas sp.]|nr:hemolysin secretion/activation protein ShlB family [Pseudomonas sp.]
MISRDKYNGSQHGRVSSDSIEFFARGQHLSASVTFAHSLERPGAFSERETPIYFQMDFFL